MPFHKLKLKFSSLLIAAAFAGALHANEGKESGKEGEGGGEAKQEAAAPKDQREFNEKNQKLSQLNSRIEEAEKQFNELVRKKASQKDKAEQERIIKEMNEQIKARNKATDEFNKLKGELELRYPNQGQQLNRRYQTQTKKSLEEMEGVAGLDELLTRTKKIVEKKFAPFQPAEVAKPKAKIAQPEEEKHERLRLEK